MLVKAVAFFLSLAGFVSIVSSFYFWLKSTRSQGIELLGFTLLASASAVILAIFACLS